MDAEDEWEQKGAMLA